MVHMLDGLGGLVSSGFSRPWLNSQRLEDTLSYIINEYACVAT